MHSCTDGLRISGSGTRSTAAVSSVLGAVKESFCNAGPTAPGWVSETERRLVIVSGGPGLADSHLTKAVDKAHRAG